MRPLVRWCGHQSPCTRDHQVAKRFNECPKTKAGRAGRQELVQAQHGTEHWACRGLAHAPDRHAELACDVRSRCLSLGRKES